MATATLLAGCATTHYPDNRTGYPFPRTERSDEHKRGNDRSYSFRELGIPKGHLPPPGECKIWFPGKPPGHQPPPQACASALREAPLGAWVVTHEGSRYRVSIFNSNKRNVVDEVRYYDTQ